MRDPHRVLAETLRRLDSLLAKDGRTRDEALDTMKLSEESGVPQDVIQALLEGEEAPAEDITERIVSRMVHLRETRLRADGRRHSYDEIASSFGASRASLSNLVNSRKKAPVEAVTGARPSRLGGPLASTQAGVERFFFGEPNGWLSAEPASALNEALQRVLKALPATAGEQDAEPRAVALRTAAALPDEKWKLLQGVIETLERQARDELGHDTNR
ncbi:hypothetical protein OHB33_40655 (plasmid) [Streptomyces sp. NBC_01558]|uniref:hypothetical protein n=1 Tax=Streptomyces sp. NBC_01558 TaxID=2975878 RepID=UPI002DDB28E2|nr:hypothetical protein [Streptomyces sp. NBC_01558]WSD82702.1 hypothetical protein OHB33_40655 [Streptomyces sp. NBC_01558]